MFGRTNIRPVKNGLYVCEIPTASSNKKRDNFADWLWRRPQALIQPRHVRRVGLANGTKRTPSQNLGNLLPELHVPPQTVLNRHFWCLFCFFYQYLAIFPTVSLYPQQKRAYSTLHPHALTESPGFPNLFWIHWTGCGNACNQRRHVSSVRIGLANGTKRTPSQNGGNLLSELQVPHEQCLTGISDAISAFFSRHPFVFVTGWLYPQQKRTYSALHPQALTECSPLDFRRSSVLLLQKMKDCPTYDYFTRSFSILMHILCWFDTVSKLCVDVLTVEL